MQSLQKCLVILMICASAGAVCAQPISIEMRNSAVTTVESTVRVGDVAELSGGSLAARQLLSQLDLEEFDFGRNKVQITSEQVRFRALLAGLAEHQLRITPRQCTTVRYLEQAALDSAVEQALTRFLSESFSLPAEHIEVQLQQSIDALILRFGIDPNDLQATWAVPAELPIGQKSFDVTLSDSQGHSAVVNLTMRIVVFRDLVMAKENISRGQQLDDSNLERVRRPVDNGQVRFASYEQALGKVAQRDLQQFALVKSQEIRGDNSPPPSTLEIKRNDLMNIIVRHGGVTVTLKNAQARQPGRVGDVIEFVNPASKRVIRAKILDSMTALIEM